MSESFGGGNGGGARGKHQSRGKSGRGGGWRGWRGRGDSRGNADADRAPPTEEQRLDAAHHVDPQTAAESIFLLNGFEKDCSHVRRCREVSRLFHLPLPAEAPCRDFVVAERTIAGIDDVVYRGHREVWECVPRGNARVYVSTDALADARDGELVRVTTRSGLPYALVGAVDGLRKFGYSDSHYGCPDAVETVVAVEKENGECGHLSAFCLPSWSSASIAAVSTGASDEVGAAEDPHRRFWVVGSKNVHIVLDYAISEECLQYYSALGRRYTYAVKIARLWKTMLIPHRGGAGSDARTPATALLELTPAQARAFHSALHRNKWTCCCEAVFPDSQHLVDYNGASSLRFYAVTLHKHAFDRRPLGTDDRATDKSSEFMPLEGLCLPVEEAAAFYRSVGLTFSNHSAPTVYASPEYTRMVDDIGRRSNSEGCVMYGADAAGKIVRLWKEKSYPYVMERAAREAITNRKLAGNDLERQLKKKLQQQRPELRHFFKDWELNRLPWLLHFAAWLQLTRRLTPHMGREELFPLRNRWLSLQREFQASVDGDPELYTLCGQYQPDEVRWGTAVQNLDVLKFVGAQGCGKSTLSRALFALLRKAEFHPQWANQDEAGNRQKFIAAVRSATQATAQVTHLLIDKMNLDAKTNQDYDPLPLSLTVTWFHPDGEEALYKVCVDRVLGRGCGHRTIRLAPTTSPEERAAQERNIRTFVRRAVRTCETPQDPPELLLELDITTPLSEMVRMIWERLQDTGTHTLPPISDSDIEKAIALAQQYETLICDLPRAPVYACITIRSSQEVAKLLSLVPATMTASQVVQREFHVTTKYFGGDVDPVLFVQLAELLGTSVTLTLEAIVGDADGVAVQVRRDDSAFPCANAVPHITISNRKGVPPKYSNALLSETAYPGNQGERTLLPLPVGTTLTGVFEFR